MPRVHGLEHIKRFAGTHLADDDSVGAHTQSVSHEVANGYRALAFEVGGAGFEGYDVFLLQAQFRGIFDGDDSFVVRYEGT